MKSTLIQRTEEFKVGDIVYFFEPGVDDPHKYIRKLYIEKIKTRGPFVVSKIREDRGNRFHSSQIMLNNLEGDSIMVKYGNNELEKLEVSGFWITKEI